MAHGVNRCDRYDGNGGAYEQCAVTSGDSAEHADGVTTGDSAEHADGGGRANIDRCDGSGGAYCFELHNASFRIGKRLGNARAGLLPSAAKPSFCGSYKLFKISDFNPSNYQEQYAKVCKATGLLLASGLQTNQGFCNLLALLMLSLLINKYQDIDGSPTSILGPLHFLSIPFKTCFTLPPSITVITMWPAVSPPPQHQASTSRNNIWSLHCQRLLHVYEDKAIPQRVVFEGSSRRGCSAITPKIKPSMVSRITRSPRTHQRVPAEANDLIDTGVADVVLSTRLDVEDGQDFNKLVRAELTWPLTIWPKGWLPGGAGPTLDPFAIEPGIQGTTSWLPVSTDIWGTCQFQAVTTCVTIGGVASGVEEEEK
ncbi:hypothetical protein K438DRAFT_1751172 [Mycena galopus ATCC 62051]|nr:hypothetical protein K438DRAFT_1751172 [Mycena galopus ATCC 62051]